MPAGEPTFVLLHSPIVGPDTWEPVAEAIGRKGVEATVPVLADDGSPPFWQQHARAVLDHVDRAVAADRRVVLAAHSGAGQLLGVVGPRLRGSRRAVAAYLFVDAGLPPDGRSRLEQLHDEEPAFADELREILAGGGGFPDWTEEQLSGLVPDPARRARLLRGVRPLPSPYWEEPLPTTAGWPDAPCAALLFGDGYAETARRAAADGWPLRHLTTGNHFLMLAEPGLVAREMLALTRGW